MNEHPKVLWTVTHLVAGNLSALKVAARMTRQQAREPGPGELDSVSSLNGEKAAGGLGGDSC
jgi:hypothetical protein